MDTGGADTDIGEVEYFIKHVTSGGLLILTVSEENNCVNILNTFKADLGKFNKFTKT